MKQNPKTPLVCFFDSGIGGLTLLKECVKLIPDARFVYFADNFNVPYGRLPQSLLINKADRFFKYINFLKPDAAVLACNTVTAQCIDFLRKKYSFPIIGIQPAIKPAAANGKCLVLATPSTAQSIAVQNLVTKYGNGRTQVFPCYGLAELIEENIDNLANVKSEIVRILPQALCDGVVLGCTHYIYIKDIIAEHYNCKVYDGLEGTANRLSAILGKYDHFNDLIINKVGFLPFSKLNIRFVGGDSAKNKAVFKQIFEA